MWGIFVVYMEINKPISHGVLEMIHIYLEVFGVVERVNAFKEKKEFRG